MPRALERSVRSPELPRWLEILFTTLAVGCLGLVLPVLWALNIRIKEIGCAQSDLNQEEFDMLLVNIDYIPGKDLDVLGIVKVRWSSPKTSARILWRG